MIINVKEHRLLNGPLRWKTSDIYSETMEKVEIAPLHLFKKWIE